MDTAALAPFVGPILAFIGIFAAAGLTWLANRSNARLQADAQRQLAAMQIEAQRRLAADARRYERRKEQAAPMREYVRRRVAAFDEFRGIVMGVLAADLASNPELLNAEPIQHAASALRGKAKLDHERASIQIVSQLHDEVVALDTILNDVATTVFAMAWDDKPHPPASAVARPTTLQMANDLDEARRAVLVAATRLDQAIDAYLDELNEPPGGSPLPPPPPATPPTPPSRPAP